EIDVQHNHIREGRTGLLEKLLHVRHRLSKLLVNPVAQNTGMRIDSDLPTDRQNVSTSHRLGMWSHRRQRPCARDGNRFQRAPTLPAWIMPARRTTWAWSSRPGRS